MPESSFTTQRSPSAETTSRGSVPTLTRRPMASVVGIELHHLAPVVEAHPQRAAGEEETSCVPGNELPCAPIDRLVGSMSATVPESNVVAHTPFASAARASASWSKTAGDPAIAFVAGSIVRTEPSTLPIQRSPNASTGELGFPGTGILAATAFVVGSIRRTAPAKSEIQTVPSLGPWLRPAGRRP